MHDSCPACASEDVDVEVVGVEGVVACAAAQRRRSEGAGLLRAKGSREGGAHSRGSVPPAVALFEKEPCVGVHGAGPLCESRTRVYAGVYIVAVFVSKWRSRTATCSCLRSRRWSRICSRICRARVGVGPSIVVASATRVSRSCA